jgi:ATP-binding cassette subfamily B protein
MSGITPQFAALSAATERLIELEQDCESPNVERREPVSLYEKMTAITAADLTFAYDRDLVFDKATFRLPKGSFGVIVGHSGIGKSTLLKLLLGIFPPQSGNLAVETGEGAVTVDRSTRQLFAYVPQGNLLLSGTLRDNILVTKQDATQEEIDRAVYISAMDDYLHTLPKGLDTVVGENAAGLSEGQAQRLSIARAILSDAPILLLDEATSALDDETERKVLARIRELPDKTCIAVTHRDAATQVADWSLEMRDGKCAVINFNR